MATTTTDENDQNSRMTREELIEHMESTDGHVVYELHPTGTHLIERPTDRSIAETSDEVYVLADEVHEYEARCSCGETYSSWGLAEQCDH